MLIAALCAATVSAEFVGGKATRDALFLTTVDITALPAMLVATSLCSILLAAIYGRSARRIAPAVLVPAFSLVSGALFLVEWFFKTRQPLATAVAVYLHISVVVPIVASGFWLIASERFDPRAAKRLFGRIAAAGTLGGLAGALIAERIAVLNGVSSMLLCLAIFQFASAVLVRMLAVSDPAKHPMSNDEDQPGLRSSVGVLAAAPHLRSLMMMVLLGTVGAALVDYLFKARAVEAFGRGDSLLRFFSLYYAATSLIAFAFQTFGSRSILERFGLGLATGSPSIALMAGSLASLVTPGFGSLLVARGGEASFRASWFRSGYELFYTPLPARERRAAKSIIDVALDRLSDALGGGLVRIIIALVPVAYSSSTLLFGAMVCSAGALLAASHLNRWYIRTLESSLLYQGSDLDLSDTKDGSTTRVLFDLKRRQKPSPTEATTTAVGTQAVATPQAAAPLDPLVLDIMALRDGTNQSVITVLSRPDGLTPELVSHVIPLLASPSLGDYAVFALRKVAEEHIGELTDALLNPTHKVDVRRRIARVFSVGVSQRAADGLLAALDDSSFDVRWQAGRSLAAIVGKNPRIAIDRQFVERVVLKEVEAARPIWEGQRLLEAYPSDAPLDHFVQQRGARSLAHVFALLSLIIPREPLQIAYRSMHVEDHHLRGTALEYLETVLPPAIRQALWPFLVKDRNRSALPVQPRAEIVADLLRSGTATLLDIAQTPNATTAGFSAA